MKQKLDRWLADTGALIPEQDERFDAAKKKLQLESAKTKGVAAQERNHARYFK
jgi:hypothetical protein